MRRPLLFCGLIRLHWLLWEVRFGRDLLNRETYQVRYLPNGMTQTMLISRGNSLAESVEGFSLRELS